LRDGLTFSNVVSVTALIFALGVGGAWAATELSKNEVKSKHIGSGQVKAKDLGKNAVSSPKIANDSVTGADIDESDLGQVQNAAAADNAAIAQFAANALSAENSGTLDGQDSSAFADAGGFRIASANSGAGTPQTLFSPSGLDVTTDGVPGSDSTVRLVNNTGSPVKVQTEIAAATTTVAPGAVATPGYAPGTGKVGTVLIQIDESDRAMLLTCGSATVGTLNMTCSAILAPTF
jgi:hypothetical protein